MSDPIVITRDKVKRPWAEPEPKIFVAGVVGFVALASVIIAPRFGVDLPSEVYAIIPVSFALLAGYLTSSVGLVVTNTSTGISEAHTGNTVASISTASIPVQPAPTAQAAPKRGTFTEVLTSDSEPADPNAATQVLSGPSRVEDWRRSLPADSPLAASDRDEY